ncbi:permease [Corynebacterium confusum]
MLISALGTFTVLLVELLLLFLVISYAVALINRRFGPERLQSWMAGGAVPGQVKGLALGTITPFCSCSTIPMFVSMLKAGVAFRTTVTYLIASPLLNPVIVGGIWLIFTWQVALSYAVIMVLLSLGAPWAWTALDMEDQLRKVKVKGGRQLDGTPWRGIKQETPAAIRQAWDDLRPMLLPMIIGVAIGAFIYGVVPEDGLRFMAGGNVWWLIPLAAVIGIPLYVRLETMLPVALALSGAGVAIGPIFAMMIGGSGASPPEISMLAAVFKPKLLATFVITILLAAMLAGYAMTIIL